MDKWIRQTVPLMALKGLRAARGMDQKAMAELIGITPATYNRKENGITPFDMREINIILKEFEVKYEDVFMGVES